MKTVFVLFNGPPKVGKDTIANLLFESLREFNIVTHRVKFAFPIKAAVNAILHKVPSWEPRDKNKIIPILGMSWRQACIWFSEEVFKPKFGDDFFGRVTAQNVKEMRDSLMLQKVDKTLVVLVSDSGFKEEANSFYKNSHIEGDTKHIIIRLHRDDIDFTNDSRGYIENVEGYHEYDIWSDEFCEDAAYQTAQRFTLDIISQLK